MTEAHPLQVTFEEERYRPVLARQGDSPTLRAVWKEAYGDDYPEGVEPLGFITATDLARVAELLEVGPGSTFVDLGCGRGGPGLWVARRTGAAVVGVDIVPEAVAAATRRSADFGVASRARYRTGSFTATGLESASFDAALSVDSLWMVLDKDAAVAEVARIVVPGGRWVCTTWEPSYFRYSDVLEAGGWDVLVCEEAANWRPRQLAVYDGILANEARLVAELGPEAAGVLLLEAREVPKTLSDYRRLLIVARPAAVPR